MSRLVIQRNISLFLHCNPSHFQFRQISNLIEEKAFVNGSWVPSVTGKTFPVHNPLDGSLLVHLPDMNDKDTLNAIEAASRAFESWKELTGKERGQIIRSFYNTCVKHQDVLAKILTLEQGKPLKESKEEVMFGNNCLEWFAEEARRIYGDVIPSPDRKKEFIMIREPIGVATLITPWNFPIAMLARKVATALACGCTCVVKPSEYTPMSALAFAYLAKIAGVPDGVINVVTTSNNLQSVSETLCNSTTVKALSFTGSTPIGKLLYNQCSSTVKKINLELGGNAPFIVFNTADVDIAVRGLIAAKFRNTGQACVSPNRVLVHSGIYENFMEHLEESIKKELIPGNGFIQNVNQGPLINEKQIERVKSLVEDALNQGAELVMGGKVGTSGPLFYEPTIVTGVKPSMRIFKEEIFGPIVSIIKFETEEEAIQLANDTHLGLAGYLYSNNFKQCWRVAKKLEMGMVAINESLLGATEIAFGGVKESGIGREGSKYGLEEYSEIKYICLGV